MNDPIQEAEHGVSALRVLEKIAAKIGTGKIRVRVHAGKVTSLVAEMVLNPSSVADVGIVADLATQLGYGSLYFDVSDGRLTTYEAMPKRKITMTKGTE